MHIKQTLKQRYYVRYNDDFLVIDGLKDRLERVALGARIFLADRLHLKLPKEKTTIRKLAWGVDFLGYVLLPNAVVVRGSTKAKIFDHLAPQNLSSYMGILKHADAYGLRQKVLADRRLERRGKYE